MAVKAATPGWLSRLHCSGCWRHSLRIQSPRALVAVRWWSAMRGSATDAAKRSNLRGSSAEL